VNTPNQRSFDFLINFFAGGFSGVIAKTATAPIERIKLLLQTQHSNDKVLRPYKGINDCFVRTVKEEGGLALWRGNMANVIRYFPTQALNFAFKDAYKGLLLSGKDHSTSRVVTMNLLAGGLAGCTSTLFVYPLDMARTRLGVDIGKKLSERQFKGPFDCIRKIYRADGFSGLYRGMGMSLVGIFLYRGLYFGSYDSGKDFVIDRENSSFFKKFMFAQLCVIFSETISYPTDTVKRKLMMQAAKKEVMYKGAVDCIRKVWKNEGYLGFMRGNFSNILRGAGSSLCLVLYDELKRHTDQYSSY
jgi:solute carrier family 25 (adenine nucleotide translocator) protein 4/5/6/31